MMADIMADEWAEEFVTTEINFYSSIWSYNNCSDVYKLLDVKKG